MTPSKRGTPWEMSQHVSVCVCASELKIFCSRKDEESGGSFVGCIYLFSCLLASLFRAACIIELPVSACTSCILQPKATCLCISLGFYVIYAYVWSVDSGVLVRDAVSLCVCMWMTFRCCLSLTLERTKSLLSVFCCWNRLKHRAELTVWAEALAVERKIQTFKWLCTHFQNAHVHFYFVTLEHSALSCNSQFAGWNIFPLSPTLSLWLI